MTIYWMKPIELSDGLPVHYVGRNSKGNRVVELLHNKHGLMLEFDDLGKGVGTLLSVRNVPEQPIVTTRWINLYDHCAQLLWQYDSKADGDERGAPNRSALLEITYEGNKPVKVVLHSID